MWSSCLDRRDWSILIAQTCGKARCSNLFPVLIGTRIMERHQTSVIRTPFNNVLVQRRSKNKSYRLSYRSCLSAASRLGLTPALTGRRLNSNRKAAKSHKACDNVNPEHLALLLKTEWKLWYVTPLYKFRNTLMKSYSRQLSAFIAAEKQQGLAVEVEQGSFRVTFSAVQGLTETDDDAMTVLVQIHSKPLFAKKDDPVKTVWSGWLTCINGNPDYLQSLSNDFTCLPLFCSSGSDVLTTLVKNWFQQAFDCSFGPLEMNQTTLEWLVALWTEFHAEHSIKHLTMIWTLPAVPPLQIVYKIDPEDARELWGSVRINLQDTRVGENEEEENIDIMEVTRFMQGLKGHFYRHFRLDLSAGNLRQVSTAMGSAKCNGRIKISHSRYMITTLTLLTECALLKIPV